ncbi:MAG: tRNA pseudouridine(38-40) synthase TruA [Bacillota bacterium]|nr:MAG: tRNA pseudouridine(38-40) synthase TruA [Bacillota bacterium]
MRNIKLLLQYDGTDYVGWAPQPNGVSIAQRLLEAIRATTGETPRLYAAGRTDAGVHARGQVVNFHTESRIPVDRFPYALNSRLPPDIQVVGAWEVPPEFHAQFHARRKLYSYTIDNSPFPSPLLRRYAAWEPQPLDVEAMRAAARILEGRHDFAAFRSTGGSARTTVRTLFRLEVLEPPPGPAVGRLLRIEAEGDGFLYNMVRILAGTLMEVGLGKRTLDQVREALATGRRELAGKTAPARGLCLERVWYDE